MTKKEKLGEMAKKNNGYLFTAEVIEARFHYIYNSFFDIISTILK